LLYCPWRAVLVHFIQHPDFEATDILAMAEQLAAYSE
jgi:hypothetical protein